MTFTWYMPTTWGEDLGNAKRVSCYSFERKKTGDLDSYTSVSCIIERPDGTRVRARFTYPHPVYVADTLVMALQDKIKKRYSEAA